MKHLSKIFCLVNLVLLFCCTTSTQAQRDGYYKMLCRGGDGAFRIDDMDDVHGKAVIGLNFTPSSRAAGGDGKGLEPGTCSWADRTLSESEPQQIQFYASAAEAQRVRDGLNSPEAFWQFSVRVTNYGFFETSNISRFLRESDRPVRTHGGAEQAGVAEAARPGNISTVGEQDRVAGAIDKYSPFGKPTSQGELREEARKENLNHPLGSFFRYNKINTKVERNRSAVTFSFETREPSTFDIEISEMPPIAGAPARIAPGETLGPSFASGTFLTAITSRNQSRLSTSHRVRLGPESADVFDADTTYHYVVIAKAPDGTYWRYVGKFKVGPWRISAIFMEIGALERSKES